MYCPNCGSNNQAAIKFCKNCGANLAVVADALTGKLTPPAEIDERMVGLLKEFYRSRKLLVISGAATAVLLMKLALVMVLGFPESMIPVALLAAILLIPSMITLIWSMAKWASSSSEMKAIEQAKQSALPPVSRRIEMASNEPATVQASKEYTTDPIPFPGSVTEQTTNLLEEPDAVPYREVRPKQSS